MPANRAIWILHKAVFVSTNLLLAIWLIYFWFGIRGRNSDFLMKQKKNWGVEI